MIQCGRLSNLIGYEVRVLDFCLLIFLVDLNFICIDLIVVAQAEPASTVENQQVEDPPSMKFTWTIDNFTRLNTKKHYSEVFVVGSYKWYLNLNFVCC